MSNTPLAACWPRGSEWRKWDLHVHSPASSGFSGDWNQFVIQLGNADCDVIGINDYISVAGYREILRRLNDPAAAMEGNKAYREGLDRLRGKTLLPVVECRMTNVVIGKKANTGQRINFHLIFDPGVSPDDIETFIKSIKVKDQSIGSRYTDSKFLLNDCSVDFNRVREALNTDTTFKDRFLIWIPYDEYGGIDDINPETDKLFKEGLVWHADILGSSNKKQADFFLWKNQNFLEDDYKRWFGKRKPCIKGSDSHNVNDEIGRLKDHNSQPIDKYCWIKADPTFGGLRQITNEPEARVHVGKLPPKIEEVQNNKTRYLVAATIRRTQGNDPEHVWFDIEVPLSVDMVAIIGNKGSGKSALADILALAGNTHCDTKHFSFLTKERFCERNGRIAKDFEVTLQWVDGSTVTKALHEKPDLNDVERVKYIPQTYLEKVCTETAPGQESEFQIELRKVIFSHISDADRLGKDTLDDLIAYKTEELREQLANHRQEIARLNAEIVRLEARATSEYTAQLEAQRALKAKELDAHVATKPAPVEQPNSLPADQQQAVQVIADELAKERAVLADLEAQIADQKARQKTLVEHIALAKKLDGRLANFEAEYERLVQDASADFQTLSLAIGDLVIVKIDKGPLAAARNSLASEKATVDANLGETQENGLPQRAAACRARIKALQERLDAPNRRYQEYLEALKAWERKKAELEGAADKPDTLGYYDAQLAYVKNTLPGEIAAQRTQRTDVARTIHGDIASIRDVYTELFASVQKLIEDSVIIREGFKLTFESSIIDHTFQLDFFDKYINQGVTGSFYSKDKGAVRLEEIRADFDFNKVDDAIGFVERILENLTHDRRTAAFSRTNLTDQLRKNATVPDLYDYLWSLEYLEPEYSLRLDGKELSHLSPGERGTLLLVFYLLVDKSSNPVIVDQPEENLDNHTVYRLLIPVIKDVKRRRQLIMVTHSPNIAVVCDAEQIIHAHIDRANGNRVEYTMGGIEAPQLNLHVINVLEGTRPAFDNRGSKYLPS
jgi:ABC-type lipoprotein export system ATPase subunit